MVNERYQDEGHEEGEYHFSDDQANYDMETDGAAKDSAAVAIAPKESITEKIKQHRKIVIGILVFIVLLGIVYKLIAPSSSPVTDFQPGDMTSASAKAPVKKAVTPPPAAVPQPTATAQAPAQQTIITTTTQPQAQPAQAVPQQPQPTMPAPVVTQPTAMPQQPVAVPPPTVSTTITTTAPPPPVEGVVQNDRTILDRVATLEQQNAAMMSLMQTQYAQKIADSELQNTQLRTQVQELTARISNMEVSFRQLTKILQGSGATAGIPGRSMANAPVNVRVSSPKSIYTVQAIIPGRAWLKTESGDTVTVAEGDMLKGFGRIVKIDPYDGIVDIDTGSKIVSLSYGASGD